MKRFALLCLPLLLPACQPSPSVEPAPSSLAMQGRALAESSCSSCHAIAMGQSSFTQAPSFPVIANQEGLTAETLSEWLEGAHNYPREMDFVLREAQVDALVAYMLTLRDPDFRRPPD